MARDWGAGGGGGGAPANARACACCSQGTQAGATSVVPPPSCVAMRCWCNRCLRPAGLHPPAGRSLPHPGCPCLVLGPCLACSLSRRCGAVQQCSIMCLRLPCSRSVHAFSSLGPHSNAGQHFGQEVLLLRYMLPCSTRGHQHAVPPRRPLPLVRVPRIHVCAACQQPDQCSPGVAVHMQSEAAAVCTASGSGQQPATPPCSMMCAARWPGCQGCRAVAAEP
jgi:hypothetical protein